MLYKNQYNRHVKISLFIVTVIIIISFLRLKLIIIKENCKFFNKMVGIFQILIKSVSFKYKTITNNNTTNKIRCQFTMLNKILTILEFSIEIFKFNFQIFIKIINLFFFTYIPYKR